MNLTKISAAFVAAALLVLGQGTSRAEGVTWPETRLLPAFSAPADVLDCIDLTSASKAEVDLFTSLEGLVNRSQPRLACVKGGSEGKFTWLELHKLPYHVVKSHDALLKYRTTVKGLVVTDPARPDTLNLATTMAGVNGELICAPELLPTLTNEPYNLPILDDLRGKFADKYAVYGYLYTNYWPRCTHRIIAGMGLRAHGDLRDYLVALKAATVWLGPGNPKDAAILKLFISDMKPNAGVYMGWWPGEGDGLEWIAKYGIPVLASDFFRNATVFSGVAHPVHIPEIPAPPPLENKVYVALILSDGDNIQYMQHSMKTLWEKFPRGSMPLGWTASPLSADLDPAMLDYYWGTATTNDCLVSGPSGAGYAHINHWDAAKLDGFARLTSPYIKRSGLRIITIWDKVTEEVAGAYARNCPDLIGLTDQSGRRSATTLGLRTIALTPAYTSSATEMIAKIKKAAAKWSGTAPVFIAAQSDVWKLGPDGLAKVAKALDQAGYKLVRPDQLFLLANSRGN